MYHHYTVVQPYLAISEARLAETGARCNTVDGFLVENKPRLHSIKVAIAPRPEMQALNRLRRIHDACHAWLYELWSAVEASHFVSVGISHPYGQCERVRFDIVVFHLTLHMNPRTMCRNVNVSGIDIRARGAEV